MFPRSKGWESAKGAYFLWLHLWVGSSGLSSSHPSCGWKTYQCACSRKQSPASVQQIVPPHMWVFITVAVTCHKLVRPSPWTVDLRAVLYASSPIYKTPIITQVKTPEVPGPVLFSVWEASSLSAPRNNETCIVLTLVPWPSVIQTLMNCNLGNHCKPLGLMLMRGLARLRCLSEGNWRDLQPPTWFSRLFL